MFNNSKLQKMKEKQLAGYFYCIKVLTFEASEQQITVKAILRQIQ